MDETAKKTLDYEVHKWRHIADNDGDDEPHERPLCMQYHLWVKHLCYGCPVQEHTKHHECVGTPYEKWKALFGDTEYRIANAPERAAAAKAMLEFLKGLRK